MNTTPSDDEDEEIDERTKEVDLFEFRASENDIVLPDDGNGGSNQSIYSAEEVNPEIDSVFDTNLRDGSRRSTSLESDSRVGILRNNIERSSSVGDEVARDKTSSSNSPKISPNLRNDRRRSDDDSAAETIYRNENSSSGGSHDCGGGGGVRTGQRRSAEKPPRWIPDEEANRCMACAVPFTAFRRRHHCRNCGGVFCGVCSNSTAPLPKYGLKKAVRVCRDCYCREVGV